MTQTNKLVSLEIIPCSGAVKAQWQTLNRNKSIAEDGYLVISILNDETTPVFFDDLKVKINRKGGLQILQENHYEPFGMSLQGLDYVLTKTENKFLFNGGTERELNTHLDETPFRLYDPQLGIFRQVDPLADMFTGINEFQFAFNNPVFFNDPTGLATAPSTGFEKTVGSMIRDAWNATPQGENRTFNYRDRNDKNPDPSKPHYFNNEKEAVKFMLSISFADKNPDKEGNVTSPETSAWILYDEKNKTTLFAVMPWDTQNKQPHGNYKNPHNSSNNTWFNIYDTKTNPTIYINSINYKIIGHIHTHPNFYEGYEGPSHYIYGKKEQLINKGDFEMNIFPIPKYIIGRNEISTFLHDQKKDNGLSLRYLAKDKKYVNEYLFQTLKNYKYGNITNDAKIKMGL